MIDPVELKKRGKGHIMSADEFNAILYGVQDNIFVDDGAASANEILAASDQGWAHEDIQINVKNIDPSDAIPGHGPCFISYSQDIVNTDPPLQVSPNLRIAGDPNTYGRFAGMLVNATGSAIPVGGGGSALMVGGYPATMTDDRLPEVGQTFGPMAPGVAWTEGAGYIVIGKLDQYTRVLCRERGAENIYGQYTVSTPRVGNIIGSAVMHVQGYQPGSVADLDLDIPIRYPFTVITPLAERFGVAAYCAAMGYVLCGIFDPSWDPDYTVSSP